MFNKRRIQNVNNKLDSDQPCLYLYYIKMSTVYLKWQSNSHLSIFNISLIHRQSIYLQKKVGYLPMECHVTKLLVKQKPNANQRLAFSSFDDSVVILDEEDEFINGVVL